MQAFFLLQIWPRQVFKISNISIIFKFLEKGRNFLNENFKLSSESQLHNPEDGNELVQGIQGIMETLAMVDYPYAANFLAFLPAWPVKEVCKNFKFKAKKSDEANAMAAYEILNIFYNSTGGTQSFCIFGNCSGPFSVLGDPDGWPWQVNNLYFT